MGKYLILDCDGVIFDSLPKIEEQIEEILEKIDGGKHDKKELYARCVQDVLFKSRAKYLANLVELKQQLTKEEDTMLADRDDKRIKDKDYEIEKHKKLITNHFLCKDYVLEEICPAFYKLIDYYKIYIMENTFPGVIDYIRFISHLNIFDRISILTQYNTEEEKSAKEKFFKKYLPMVDLIFVPFHPLLRFDDEKKIVNEDRERSNKMIYYVEHMLKKGFSIQEILNELESSYYIDDSKANYDDANFFIYKDDGKEYEGMCGNPMLKMKDDSTLVMLKKIVSRIMQNSNKEKVH